MTYYLNQISKALTVIAYSLAVFGIGKSTGFAEEICRVEQVLRKLYPDGLPTDHKFGAVLAVHGIIIGVAAAEDRQQAIEARAEATEPKLN